MVRAASMIEDFISKGISFIRAQSPATYKGQRLFMEDIREEDQKIVHIPT